MKEVITVEAKKKFYQTKWFMWIWFIIFPPIGLVLLWTLHRDMKKLVKIILSAVFGMWTIIFALDVSGALTDNTAPIELSREVPANDFVENVKTAIQGDGGENEVIKDVSFENKELCVYVDFSKVDPAPLTIEDLAISRTSSITDAILELKEYDNVWDTIIVDFGEVGKIKNEKVDIKENEYGGRYFPSENFKLH